jgi:subtilisin family serine protease
MVVTGIAAPASADVQDLTDDDQHHSDPSQRVVSIDTAQAIAGGSPTGAWFVELSRPATSLGGSTAGVNAQQSSFLSTASSQGVSLDVKFEYETLWNGLSVVTDDSNIDAILGMPGVQGVWPVEVVDAPTTLPNNQPDMLSAVTMTGADVAYSELGLDGTGVHVAIMDTGVDYNHPDFGGSGTPGGDTFPTARVTTGYDFVGDDYNADPESDAYQPVPHPDNDPDDCQGHGTHVAGIVGADGDPAAGGVRGVAPGVTFGAYRVFGCDGSTETDIMNTAMERAYQDGADVLNMSIGAAFAGWNDYPTAVLSSRMSDLGMIVVASAGNEGEYGPWAAGAPGNGAGVIGVAMYDNVEVLTDALTLAPSGDQIGYMLAAGSPAPETGTEYTEFTSAGAPGTAGAQACEALGDEFAGTVAVLQRGNCDFYTKALNAQNAGATAVIMYNNAPGLINPTVEGAEEITIPVFFVDQQDGIDVIEQIGTDGFSVTASGDLVSVPNPTGGLINTGSSFGADAELNLKPNIGAPGGSIYSTYPLEDGGYASLTGTSMASPHVAGTVALYLEAHPGTDAATVRDVLQNYSEPALWNGNPDLGYLEATHRQGAGMVQIDEAILAEVIASPGQISLGESVGNLGAGTVNLTSTSDQDITYTVEIEDAVSTAGSQDYGVFIGESTYAGPTSVTVPAGGSAPLDYAISPDPALEEEGAQYGGYLILTPDVEGVEPISIPYYGFAGDYQQVPLFQAYSGIELPLLASLTECDRFVGGSCASGGSWSFGEEGQVFSMEELDSPGVIYSFENNVQELTIRAFPADQAEARTGGGIVYHEDTVGLSSSFEGYSWNGTVLTADDTRRVALPDGDYVLEITAVAPMGTEAAGQFERWTSPSFTIDRDGEDVPTPPPAGPVATFYASNTWADGPAEYTYTFGQPTDEILVGDWDGDGVDTIAVRRGNRYLINNSVRGDEPVTEINFGRASDTVLVGDWNGDGFDTLAVRRGATYFISNRIATGPAEVEVTYGRAADDVYVGDFDGDRTDSLMVRRGNTYFISNSLRGGPADVVLNYGRASDTVLVGDWDGDDLDTLAVRRGNEYFVRNDLSDGRAEYTVRYGRASDIVHVGDWNGDGTDTPAVQR